MIPTSHVPELAKLAILSAFDIASCGFIIPSERPGLGHDLREDVARSLRPDGPGHSLVRSY